MRRPQVLTPAWFVLVVALAVLGGIGVQLVDVNVFADDDERFRWSGVVFFAVTMIVLQTVFALGARRQRRAQGLS